MLNKGAETLPNKAAHDYKALAVNLISKYRNNMMQRITKRV